MSRRDLTQLMGKGQANSALAEGFTRMFDEGDRADPSLVSYSRFCVDDDFDYALPCNVRGLAVLDDTYIKKMKPKHGRGA